MVNNRHDSYIEYLVNNIGTVKNEGRWFLIAGSFLLAEFTSEDGAKRSLENNIEMYEHILMTQLDEKYYVI